MYQNLDLKFSFCFQFPPSRGIGLSGVVRVGRGVGGFGLYLTWKSMYQISASYCAWPGSLILFKFQPSQGTGLSGVLRLRMGGGGLIHYP